MKWGVKVPFVDAGYLWVTMGDSKFQLEPMLFDTKELAEKYAQTVWGPGVIVELYGENQDTL